MSTFNLTPARASKLLEHNWDDPAVPIESKGIVRLPKDILMKTGKEYCVADFAWLQNIGACRLPVGVRVPQLRSGLVRFDFEDADIYGFVMEQLKLKTLEAHLRDNAFDDALADQIVKAYLDLRSAAAELRTPYVVPNYPECVLQGHMFPDHGGTPKTVTTQDQLKSILQSIIEDPTKFNEQWELTLGDLSAEDTLLVIDSTKIIGIAFIDFGYTMMLPSDYDLWHLKKHCHDTPKFYSALLAAFERQKMILSRPQSDAFDIIRKYFRR